MPEHPKLSKSKFVAGCQCPKRLYWIVHEPQRGAPPDEAQEALFASGYEVGEHARRAFPGGVLVDEDYIHHSAAALRTQKIIDDKSVPAIFEAAFVFENIRIRVDVLERCARGEWRLIEVKQSTSVKDYHIPDVAIQKYVLEGLGIQLSGVALMHLNREYVYAGGEYDYSDLFTIQDVGPDVAALEASIADGLDRFRETLVRPDPPAIEPGAHCTRPFVCEFYDVCNKALPIGHVSCLPSISANALEALEDKGIEKITDIPDGFPLTDRQKRAWHANRIRGLYINESLSLHLDKIRYPLCHLDFETLAHPLPKHPGTKPYDPIPFQWSVHVQRSQGTKPEHFDFMADDGTDPREACTRYLLEVLKKYDGHITIYTSYETRILSQLAKWLPQYGQRIEAVIDRLWDLHRTISNHTYHLEYAGSFSLKAVLPAIVPEMTYEGLEVADGNQAGRAFLQMISPGTPADERKRLREALLEYCGQDSMAMVRILDRLHQVAETK